MKKFLLALIIAASSLMITAIIKHRSSFLSSYCNTSLRERMKEFSEMPAVQVFH